MSRPKPAGAVPGGRRRKEKPGSGERRFPVGRNLMTAGEKWSVQSLPNFQQSSLMPVAR